MATPQFKPCDKVRWHPAYTQKAIDLRIIRLLEIDQETGEPWYTVYNAELGHAFPLPEHVLRPLPRPNSAEWSEEDRLRPVGGVPAW